MRKSYIVSKSNKLARTGNDFSLQEARMVEYCLSTLYMKDKVTADTIFEIDVEAMGRHFGISKSNAHRELKKALIAIASRRIIFTAETDSDEWTVNTTWISAVYHNDKKDGIRIQLSPAILPHICGEGIKKNFTTYKLEDISKFKSSYSIILYNFCKSFAHKYANFTAKITVAELKEKLDIHEGEYKLFGGFSRMLKQCIQEIEEQTGLCIRMKYGKTAKEVTELEFIMSHKPTEVLHDRPIQPS
jgi:plasmid replication initiation protein